MTLLVAPFDVSTQPPAARWKCSQDESQPRSGKLPQPRRRWLSIVAGNYVWLWTLVAAVFAIMLPALLNNTASLHTSIEQDDGKPATEPVFDFRFDIPNALHRPEAFALEENSLAPRSLSYHGNILNEGKLLLGHEDVALLAVLQPSRTQLADAIQLNLRSLMLAESLTSPSHKAKRKSAGQASGLARVTVYWPAEGDFYTRNRKSSTGTRLRDGHCAVDPKVIPYGSVVNVPGIGRLVAVDTGGAVKSRRAARLTGRTREQRGAIVIDVFCSTRAKAKALIKRIKHFAVITWHRPDRVAEL
jgi:3D (Asp-Asp-Asp) domain-containing protein